jgi:hypothetical protein
MLQRGHETDRRLRLQNRGPHWGQSHGARGRQLANGHTGHHEHRQNRKPGQRRGGASAVTTLTGRPQRGQARDQGILGRGEAYRRCRATRLAPSISSRNVALLRCQRQTVET